MSDATTKVIEGLNELAKARFDLQVQVDAANQEFKNDKAVREAAHTARLAPLEAKIEEIDAQLWKELKDHESSLIEEGKRSFVTMAARFQLKTVYGTRKVTDAKSLMKIARKLGIVRRIAVPVHEWKLSQEKFFAWLDKNGEARPKFDGLIEETQDDESLTIKPNSNYTVFLDKKRVSPPSISIKKPVAPGEMVNES
jgi:phage host-nuclease inhibitor protein Gam